MSDKHYSGEQAGPRGEAPARIKFWGKTWIIVAAAIVTGTLGMFCLALGPLILLDEKRPANGQPGRDAGITLCVMSVPMLLVFALAVSKFRARRRPVLQLFREGIELLWPERSSLDGLPMVPVTLRLAWSILSGSGFRSERHWVAWESIHEAFVAGGPTNRYLTINLLMPRAQAGTDPRHGIVEECGVPTAASKVTPVMLPEVSFVAPLDEIAAAICYFIDLPDERERLTSWDGDAPD